MKELNINNINTSAPYHVYHEQNRMDYYLFQTDQGIVYSVSFSEEFEIGGCMSYQYSIGNKEEIHGTLDIKIRLTCIAIIKEFFKEYQNVLLFICDTSDHREKARNRLFLNWFKEYASPADFIILSAHQQIEEQGWYASIIVSKANPLLESIKEDFYDMTQGFQK